MDMGKTLKTLEALDLPIGWHREDLKDFTGGGLPLLALIAGWLIVAVATLFGAPFWFDALQRIIRIKGSVEVRPKNNLRPAPKLSDGPSDSDLGHRFH
jgi:hypothetical protein